VPKLTLRFENSVLKEYSLFAEPVTIGRPPHNLLFLSTIPLFLTSTPESFFQQGNYYVRDVASHNGTFVNGNRITQALLRGGDTIAVGKHTVRFSIDHPGEQATGVPVAPQPPSDAPARKLDGTAFLDVRARREYRERFAAAKATARAQVGKLTVLRGKTSTKECVLTAQASIIWQE
jgi:pSer/pThr/pTyr-binding forkhead associated (FHA) protein